jgi:hypothetical protein
MNRKIFRLRLDGESGILAETLSPRLLCDPSVRENKQTKIQHAGKHNTKIGPPRFEKSFPGYYSIYKALTMSSVVCKASLSPLPLASQGVTRRFHVGDSLPLRISRTCHYSLQANNRNVRIVEVGPRDGLQNIKQVVPKETKVELIKRLAETGLLDIEATSFVSPKWVPQLADGEQVMKEVLAQIGHRDSSLRFPVLAPNLIGLKNAKAAGAKEIVVFASVTEAFSKANQNCTVDEAINHARVVTKEALSLGIKVRGSVIQEY